ncbi:MAG: asparagine synthase [Methanomassiliicoccales archaeon]|nr:MAG: asparagine synthase [Methanomassiliicoccales archaeon]
MNHIEKILVALDESVRKMLGGRDVGVLFSGGIDSCVIAVLANRCSKASLYTVGMEGSYDLKVAESTANRLDMEWKGIVLCEDDVVKAIKLLKGMVKDIGPLTISFEVPLLMVATTAKEGILTSGQGADELFGGYDRYVRMDRGLLREEMRRDIAALIEHGSPMEKAIASKFGKDLRHPFLDPSVVEASSDLPMDLVIHGGERKVALRHVARSLGLIEEADRKKKAAQYGSGVMKVMRSMAKRQGMDLRTWVERTDPDALRG